MYLETEVVKSKVLPITEVRYRVEILWGLKQTVVAFSCDCVVCVYSTVYGQTKFPEVEAKQDHVSLCYLMLFTKYNSSGCLTSF